MIRILLVEPMTLLRGALAAVLSAEDDLEMAAELAQLDEAILIAKATRPDVAVVDIDLFSSPTAAHDLTDASPGCAVLVLADSDSPGMVRAALDTRVRGFICKSTAPSQLAHYIRRMARGERVIDPGLAVAALSVPSNPLTARECEVLRVAALGLPSAEIASQLHLSVGTVRNYLSAIMRKTGGRNRLEAIRIAEEAGWLWVTRSNPPRAAGPDAPRSARRAGHLAGRSDRHGRFAR